MSRKSELDPNTVRAIRERYFDGSMTQVELAKLHQISQPTVSKIVRGLTAAEYGGPINTGTNYATAEFHGRAKLTPKLAKAIRAEYAISGCSLRSLARKHLVCVQTIAAVIKGETWAPSRPSGSTDKGELE